jgi:hypothetical protein
MKGWCIKMTRETNYISTSKGVVERPSKRTLTKQEAGELIARHANNHCLSVYETFAYENAKDFYGFVEDDFVNDESELTQEDLIYGQYNWKYIGGAK